MITWCHNSKKEKWKEQILIFHFLLSDGALEEGRGGEKLVNKICASVITKFLDFQLSFPSYS